MREHTAIDLERARLVISAQYRAVGRSGAAVHHVSRGIARLGRVSSRRSDGEGRRASHAQPAQTYRHDGSADDGRVQVRLGEARTGEHDALSQSQARHGAYGAGRAGINVLLALVFLFLYGLLYRALYSVQFLLDMIWLTAYIQSGTGHFQHHPGLAARRLEGALCAAARCGLCKADAL